MEQFLQYGDHGLFLLRLAVAAIFLAHGLPKLKKANAMAVVGIVELVSAIALVVGLYMQYAAAALSIVMVGAIYMKLTKWRVPFMAMDKMGWEFDLVLLAANLVIITTGGGSIRV